VRDGVPWNGVGLVAAWEIQSQLATFALIGLLAVMSVLPALAIMLCWSLVAGVVYCHGRRRGMPDLLEAQANSEPALARRRMTIVGSTLLSVTKAWLAGVQPFLYSRTACRVLTRPANCWRLRLARQAVLFVGLTLFGVTTAHHMLRKAGYSEGSIVRLSLAGSCLNVPYRILLSAAVLNVFTHFIALPI
jgi:hypothetical protein